MRLATKSRSLTVAEGYMAGSVFGDSLPRLSRIRITDGLGPIPGQDNPNAQEHLGGLVYQLNLGPDVYPDATLTTVLPGYGRYKDIFIHELTHIWQYDKGYFVVLSSAWANCCGDGYDYVVGKAWDDYNVEQQAQLVEDWFAGGMLPSDDRYPYIEKIIRPGVGKNLLMDINIIQTPLADLRKM